MTFDISNLLIVDYFIITIILLSVVFAAVRGFIGSLLSLIGWVASIYLAYIAYPSCYDFFKQKLSNELFTLLIGHASLLLGFLVVIGIINHFLEKLTKKLAIGFFDKLLGASFGFIRGFAIVSFLFLVFNAAHLVLDGSKNAADINKENKSLPKWLTTSQSFPYLLDGQRFILQFIPEDFMHRIHKVVDFTSKTTPDERFANAITNKLAKSLDEKEKELVEERLQSFSLFNSIEQVENEKLREYYELYKKQNPADQSKSGLTNDDIRKVKDHIHRSEELDVEQ